MKRLSLGLVLFAVVLLAGGAPLSACMNPDPWYCYIYPWLCYSNQAASGLAGPGDAFLTFTGSNRARLEIGNYITPEMSVIYECVVALPPIRGVVRVDRIYMINDQTREELPGYSWVGSQGPVAEFAQMIRGDGILDVPDSNWNSYFTSVPGSRGGIVHRFVFELSLSPGTTPQKLVRALQEQGVLANASANADGTLDYGHWHFRRLADSNIHVVYPGRAPREDRGPGDRN